MSHFRLRLLPAAVALLLLTGNGACGKEAADKPSDAKQDADSRTSTTPACGLERATALEREMLRGCAVVPNILPHDVPAVPWTVEAPTPPRLPSTRHISLRADGVHVEGNPPISIDDWAQELPPADVPSPRLAWELSIEPELSGAKVATALGHLARTGNATGSIVLATPVPDDLPEPIDPKRLAKLHNKLREADPASRAATIAGEIVEAMPPCPALREAFSAVATVPPEQRCSTLATGFAKATVTCGCPDMDEVLTLVYAVAVGSEVPTALGVAVPTVLDSTAKPHTGATWGDIVATLERSDFAALAIVGP